MKFIRTTTATLVASLFLLPACRPQHKSTQIKPIEKTFSFHETKNDITISAETLGARQLSKIFGSKGSQLAKNDILPLQISITNDRSESITFDPSLSTVFFANHAKVASILQRNTSSCIGGIVALGSVCLLFTGLFALANIGMAGFTGYSIYLLGTLPALGVLILTPTASYYYCNQIEQTNIKISNNVSASAKIVTIATQQNLKTILILRC